MLVRSNIAANRDGLSTLTMPIVRRTKTAIFLRRKCLALRYYPTHNVLNVRETGTPHPGVVPAASSSPCALRRGFRFSGVLWARLLIEANTVPQGVELKRAESKIPYRVGLCNAE